MTWVKTCDKNYRTTGMKKPVFLWDDLNKKRIFIDVPKGAKVELQYSYDEVKLNEENNASVRWHSYEAGYLESDFAFEIIGISAVRLHIQKPEKFLKNQKVQLAIYQHKLSNNKVKEEQ